MEVLNSIKQKFNHLSKNLNEYLFMEVYAFVLDKLRLYYEKFKLSSKFQDL